MTSILEFDDVVKSFGNGQTEPVAVSKSSFSWWPFRGRSASSARRPSRTDIYRVYLYRV